MNSESITWFGSLNKEGSGLWINKAHIDFLAGKVVYCLNRVIEGILRPESNSGARLDGAPRGIPSKGIRELFSGWLIFDDLHLTILNPIYAHVSTKRQRFASARRSRRGRTSRFDFG